MGEAVDNLQIKLSSVAVRPYLRIFGGKKVKVAGHSRFLDAKPDKKDLDLKTYSEEDLMELIRRAITSNPSLSEKLLAELKRRKTRT